MIGVLFLPMFHLPFHLRYQYDYTNVFKYCYLNVSGWLARIGEGIRTSSSWMSMTLPNARKRKPQGNAVSLPAVLGDELVLHGDISELIYAFTGHRRCLLTCSVPDSIYMKMKAHPGGISQFFEDAVATFDGDLEALVNAAVLFVEQRRLKAAVDPPRNTSGRVDSGTFEKVERINQALSEIRGMSRAKVLAGLIAIFLNFKLID